jgi:hypothetical protein
MFRGARMRRLSKSVRANRESACQREYFVEARNQGIVEDIEVGYRGGVHIDAEGAGAGRATRRTR